MAKPVAATENPLVWLGCVLLLARLLSVPTAAASPPPDPPDITAPGKAWPEYPQTAFADNSPQIGAINPSARPGETLVITGRNLAGAQLRIAVGSEVTDVEPLRSADDRMQAVVPDTLGTEGVVLVSPTKDGDEGEPIRVNAPEAFWAWPCRYPAGSTHEPLRVFGRNLVIEGHHPVAYLVSGDGDTYPLNITEATRYTLTINVPDEMSPGSYKLHVHNGTGAQYGWSDPIDVESVNTPPEPTRKLRIDDYLASNNDTDKAIRNAIRDAQRNGGGVIVFGPRTYQLDNPVIIPFGPPVILQGAGRGAWNPATGQPGDDPHTQLISTPKAADRFLIDLQAPGSSVRDVMIVDETPDRRAVIHLAGFDQTVQRASLVRLSDDGQSAAVECHAPGEANQQVLDCVFDVYGRAVRVTRGTHYTRIADCLVRGHYTHGRGTESNAVTNWGGSQMILERNEVRGADRAHGKAVGRTCLLYNQTIRNGYLANNQSLEVGSHSSVPGMLRNLSEQYLFHSLGNTGGVFEVRDATPDRFYVNGGPVPDLKTNGDWIVFITRGVGVGQWRVINYVHGDGAVGIDQPWRITPKAGSVVIVQPAFRHNIVVNNTIDPAPDPVLADPDHKTVGVYFYHRAFDNIVASNTINNVSVGASIAADADTPSAWNLIRDNTFHSLAGYAGGSASGPMAYCEFSRGLTPDQRNAVTHWLSVGNRFIANTIDGAPTLAAVSWRDFDRQHDLDYQHAPDRGLVMTVIENNRLSHVGRGVLLGAPANWTLIRNNTSPDDQQDIQSISKQRARVVDPLATP